MDLFLCVLSSKNLHIFLPWTGLGNWQSQGSVRFIDNRVSVHILVQKAQKEECSHSDVNWMNIYPIPTWQKTATKLMLCQAAMDCSILNRKGQRKTWFLYVCDKSHTSGHTAFIPPFGSSIELKPAINPSHFSLFLLHVIGCSVQPARSGLCFKLGCVFFRRQLKRFGMEGGKDTSTFKPLWHSQSAKKSAGVLALTNLHLFEYDAWKAKLQD